MRNLKHKYSPKAWGKLCWCCECKKEYQRKWSRKNKDSVMNWRLQYQFGITLETYKKLFEKQNGLCKICKQKEKSKRYMWLTVDHDHKTNKIRGLLCHLCNKALGVFKNVKILKSAMRYLNV